MKKNLTILIFSVLGITTASAQSLFDKIDRIASKVDNATYKVERAANTADRSTKTGGKIISMLSGKNGAGSEASVGSSKTTITLLNADLAKLKKLNSALENSGIVSSTQMKFNAEKSSITVVHSGSTEDLLEAVQPKSKDVFTDSNIQSLDKGKITLKL